MTPHGKPTPLPTLLTHLGRALSLEQERCRRDGYTAPPEIKALTDLLLDWASAVLSGPEVANGCGGPDAAFVPAPLLLPLGGVAEYLGCSLSTVKRLIADGSLPTVTVGGTRRVRRIDVEAYVEGLRDGRHIETKRGA